MSDSSVVDPPVMSSYPVSDSSALDTTAASPSTMSDPTNPDPFVTSPSSVPYPSAPHPSVTSSSSTSSTSSLPSLPAKPEGGDSGEDAVGEAAEIEMRAFSDAAHEDDEESVALSSKVFDVGESQDDWVLPPSVEEADVPTSFPHFPYPDQAVDVDDDDGDNDTNAGDDDDARRRLIGAASEDCPPQWLDDNDEVVGSNASVDGGRDDADGDDDGVNKEDCLLLHASYQMHKNVEDSPAQKPPPMGSVATISSSETTDNNQLLKSTVQRPVRTCAVLCFAFFFVYTANLAIQNLQSSLNQAAGLGITSLAVLYGAIIVFGSLSPLVIRLLNAKRTLVVAFVCHLLYTASNFYPTFPTLLTSSLLLGALAGPMWTAQGLYCTATGLAYAQMKQDTDGHGSLSLFNGVFFAFYESTQISGNLIASAVLMRGNYNETDDTDDVNRVCGAAVCPDMQLNSTVLNQPEEKIVYILLSIYLACNVIGLVLTIFALPPLPRDQEIQTGESSLKKSTLSCLSMLLVPKMVLLLPFFMAQAMNSGILLAEYNEKFVSCTVGIQWVGYVMTSFGVLTAAQAVGLNYAAKYLGRRVLFTAAALADLSVNVTMLLWDPTHTTVPRLFILPCVAGFAEGIFQAQFNSLVAMVFPEKKTAAFATYHTSKATAFTITFVLARFLCLNERLYLSLALSTLGLLGYAVVEVMIRRKRRQFKLAQQHASVQQH